MKLRLLLLAVLVALSVVFTVPAAAQPVEEPNADCSSSGYFPGVLEEGFICFADEIPLQCPGSEEVAVGDILSCFTFFETGETFDCLVLGVFPVGGEKVLSANCTQTGAPPDDGNGGGDGRDGNGGGGGAAPLEITQESEQESEAGEIAQSFDVS